MSWPAWRTLQHGTDARARKHYREGEQPCPECYEAQRQARNRRNSASQARAETVRGNAA